MHWGEAGIQNNKDLVDNYFKVITYREFRNKDCLSAYFRLSAYFLVTSASLELKIHIGTDQGFAKIDCSRVNKRIKFLLTGVLAPVVHVFVTFKILTPISLYSSIL